MTQNSSLYNRLTAHALRDPGRCALVSAQERIPFDELLRRVDAQAAHLASLGVSGEDSVGIECADDVQHLLLCLAAARLGATSCTIPTHETAQQRGSIRDAVGVSRILDASMVVRESGEAVPSNTGGARFLFSTSGTTGRPKLVTHEDAGLVAQAHRHVLEPERFACLASMEHNFVKRHRLYCVAEGATNVFLDPDPRALVAQCRSLEVTTLHVSAFQAQGLLGVPGLRDVPRLRLKLGGSHVATDLRRRLREQITDDVCFGYGTTETGAIAFTDPDDIDARESVGSALPGLDVRVVDVDRTALPCGERGEIAIRGEGMFLGYHGQSDLTAQRLVDGWFYTGDSGHVDAAGRIHLCGRVDDMFVFNSINIFPQDIEAELCRFPAVLDVAVLPKHSPVHGDIPVALVVFEGVGEPDVRNLKRFAREHVGVRCPRQFTVVEQIPRNDAGKILRGEAKALFEAGAS